MTSPLEAWLAEAGVTKQDLATAGGIRYATVHDVAKGHVPTVDTARRIAAAAAWIVTERGLSVEPITAAAIVGLEDVASTGTAG